MSELSSKHSAGGRVRVATTKSDTKEDLIKAKNEEALAKKKGIAFSSMKAAKEDDPSKRASGRKKKKKKGFLTGIFSSKSKKSLSSAELREQEGEEEKVFLVERLARRRAVEKSTFSRY